VLHVERVFAGMRWADASRVAAAVVMDVCRRCLRDDDVQTLLGHARHGERSSIRHAQNAFWFTRESALDRDHSIPEARPTATSSSSDTEDQDSVQLVARLPSPYRHTRKRGLIIPPRGRPDAFNPGGAEDFACFSAILAPFEFGCIPTFLGVVDWLESA